jgi:L-asparaginase
VPTLSGEALVAAVPELRDIASIRVTPLVNIDSRNMAPELWLRQAWLIEETLRDPAVTGIVVTHGTDTMEESAYFVDLTLASQKPVVYTGAQRDATARDADGPRNLLNAVRQVIDPDARGHGVTVTLNGKILAARHVTKSHTGNVQAFSAGDAGQLGEIDDTGVRWFNRPERPDPLPIPISLPEVDIVSCYPGADGSLVDASVRGGARGIVVVGYGIGNVNQAMFDAISRARERDVHVMLATRVPAGNVYPVYGGAGGGNSLKALGVVFGGSRLPWKARIELMLLLTQAPSAEDLQRLLDR